MTERDQMEPSGYDSIKDFESAKEAILNYVRGLEFGTPAYLACCDYHRHEELWGETVSLREVVNDPARSVEIYRNRITPESALRINEQKLALLDFQIANRNAEIKGYKQAYEAYSELRSDQLGESVATMVSDMNPKVTEEEGLSIANGEMMGIFRITQGILDEKAK